jgi:hypothetical protein
MNCIFKAKYNWNMRSIVGRTAYLKTFQELYQSGITLITTFGLQPNSYSIGLVQNSISMDALFED